MKDKLIVITCIVLFGLALSFVAPRVNAWAGTANSNTIECEAGAQVIQLPEGRIRIIGECTRIPGYEPEPTEKVYSPYDEAYPEPEPAYPEPEPNRCDTFWIFGEICLP